MEILLKQIPSLFLHRSRTKEQAVQQKEQADLLMEIAEIRSRIECVKNRFDLLTDPDLIDACIYEMEGLERRYGYLLKRARTLGIKNQKIGALETYPAEMAP
ncbi:MAG TPA: YaaL family protein [Firmicutes bacterium]|nr:YaaL family protein [Bacillota bacterium]